MDQLSSRGELLLCRNQVSLPPRQALRPPARGVACGEGPPCGGAWPGPLAYGLEKRSLACSRLKIEARGDVYGRGAL